MPPHRGHQYLIEFARARVEQLTIILFSKSSEPIPGELRAAWLREFAGDAAVLHVTEEHPVDFQNPAIWDWWIAAIRRVYPQGPDMLFSSEVYGEELAWRLGAQHVMVDMERKQVPVSGTQIREHPMQYWDFIVPPARGYYAKRVCILGAESTGKTTLAAALAERFQTVWVPEYAREYLEAKQGACEWSDMVPIAEGQVALEDALARQANRLLICDTNLIATMLWSEHYWGAIPDRIQALHAGRRYDLNLITDVDVPWQRDDLRDSPHMREWFHARYQSELRTQLVPFQILSGPLPERIEQACRAIEQLL